MTFYDNFENDLSNDYILLNQKTTDIFQRDNDNSSFLLSTLNEFIDMKNISPEIINEFNLNINQRVAWENIILFEKYDARKTFNFPDEKYLTKNIPDDYFLTFESDSIIDASLEYFNKYLNEKYINFDFNTMKNILDRKEHFNSFDYIFKVFNMFECLLPTSIKKSYTEIESMFNVSIKDRIDKMHEKSYIGVIWNMASSYLSKCDQDIYTIFIEQHWDFISSFVVKNYM